MTIVRITSPAFTDSTSKIIKCSRVTYGLKRGLEKTPNANIGELVEVQTNSFENPIITIQGLMLTEESGTITLKNIQELIKSVYDGTNASTISIEYSNYSLSGDRHLTSLSDLSTTDIPVVLSSHSLNIDASDSKDAYLPVGSLTFTETL